MAEEKEGMEEKVKSKIWTLQLYTENVDHMLILEYIKQNYVYAYIVHNKDIFEDTGELKKEHIHVIIFPENQRSLRSIQKETKLEINLIQKVKSKKFMIRYLIHKDNPEKAQYKKENIITNTKEEIEKALKEENENEQIKEIINKICTHKGYITMTEITRYALQEEYYGTLRRGIWIIKNVIEEHNALYQKKK